MRLMMRWSPWDEMGSMRDVVERAFSGTPWRDDGGDYTSRVPVDAYEEGDEVVVRALLPGVRPEDLKVSLKQGVLHIEGVVPAEPDAGRAYLSRELWSGQFKRSLTLSPALNGDKVGAHFRDGVLTLRIPKAEEARRKLIEVKAA